jgi:hypothetical protein
MEVQYLFNFQVNTNYINILDSLMLNANMSPSVLSNDSAPKG